MTQTLYIHEQETSTQNAKRIPEDATRSPRLTAAYLTTLHQQIYAYTPTLIVLALHNLITNIIKHQEVRTKSTTGLTSCFKARYITYHTSFIHTHQEPARPHCRLSV